MAGWKVGPTLEEMMLQMDFDMDRVKELVENLKLEVHPEGGYFTETYRSDWMVENYDGQLRSASTGIYFLITKGNFSAFHRIRSDEMWHFYEGSPLVVHILHEGQYRQLEIGPVGKSKSGPQAYVPKGAWFASEVQEGGDYSLVGCTVAPGFDFADFELAKVDELLTDYPAHSDLIRKLCRDD